MLTLRPIFSSLALLVVAGVFVASPACAGEQSAAASKIDVYDEAAYTQYVEDTMQRLDKLYLEFCAACDTDREAAWRARQEFLVAVGDLMKHMNSRFDSLDPKQGAALSPTETLVSIHALTMLVDILSATQLEQLTAQVALPAE
jgi:hypothetical protein